MSSVAEPLIKYLHQLKSYGQTHVTIDDDVRPILREFFIRAKTGKLSSNGAVVAAAVSEEPPQCSGVKVPEPTTPAKPVAAVKASTDMVVSGASKGDKINSLKQQAANWPAIKALGSLRQTLVFSAGNPDADIMLVGEAPGFDEERLLEPFVGQAGQKLNGILAAMGIDRKDAYLTNIVKFRPSTPNQTTNNRKPTAEEMKACLPFFHKEVEVVKPKVIIALGGTAAQVLLSSKDSVGGMRGSFHEFASIPLRVTYHPSYILHNEATTEKRKLWEDMLSVMELLGMGISEKQRDYFLPRS